MRLKKLFASSRAANPPQVWPAAGGLKADTSAFNPKSSGVCFAKFAQIAGSKLTGLLQINTDLSHLTGQGVPCSKR